MINIQNIICGYEIEIVRWIKNHYKELGYEKIIKSVKINIPKYH